MPVFHRPESRFYWYQFAVDGRRYRGSTKVTNKTTAEMISGKKFLEVVDGRAPLPRKAPRLVEFSERFLSWVERSNLQDQTKLYYRAGWRLLSLTPIAPLRLTEIGDDRAASLFFPAHRRTATVPSERFVECFTKLKIGIRFGPFPSSDWRESTLGR